MSPNTIARHRPTIRKIALCVAALSVAVLPTACGAAYADPAGEHSGHHRTAAAESNAADGSGDAGAEEADAGESGPAESGTDDAGAPGQPAADENGGQNPDQGREQGRDQGGDQGGGRDDGRGGEQGDDRGNGQNGGQGDNGQGNEQNGDQGNGQGDGGLDVLGTDCSNSELEPHDGLEKAPRCVDTSFGEVAAQEQSPSLLIANSPQTVRADEDFTLSVSTRNLVRDRFLGAADGGYYKEASFLNEEGIQRGHFHTACRMLDSVDAAPDAAPEPEFFLATQDNGGGAGEDTVEVPVTGLPRGTAQCAVWAGDGSHRIPMMQRANQIPAFDSVRITVE